MKKQLILYCSISLLFLTTPVKALQDINIVTYADFSHIRDIAVSMNYIYFATSEGIIIYDKISEEWISPLSGTPNIDYRNIFKIYVDQFDRSLFARTEINSYEYDMTFANWSYVNEIPQIDKTYYDVSLPPILYVEPNYFYSGNGYIQDDSGFEYPIIQMVREDSGVRWISVWGLGAAKVGHSDLIEFLPYGLIQNRVNTILYSDGTLIVGGDNVGSSRTGLTFFDIEQNSFSYKESGLTFEFPDEDIRAIEEDDKFYYLATLGGLAALDKETLEVTQIITERNGLISDQLLYLKKVKDKLYIGSLYGLQVLNENSDSLKLIYSNQFQNQSIYDFALTDSTLWIASEVGAYQLHLGSLELKKFRDPFQIASGRVYNIERYEENLFIASSSGMVRLNLKTGKTTSFRSDSHGTNHRALAVNDDVAFISTDFGFEMFYLTESGFSNSREFTTSDGIPSQFVFDLLLDGDYLWVGTDRGLSQFLWNDPDRID